MVHEIVGPLQRQRAMGRFHVGLAGLQSVQAIQLLVHACDGGREDLLGQLRETQQRACRREDDNARFTRLVGAPGVEAVVAFVEGRYGQCADLLRSIRNQAQLFGGSHAQRDLLDQTLIAAAIRGNQTNLARALQRERERLAEQRRML